MHRQQDQQTASTILKGSVKKKRKEKRLHPHILLPAFGSIQELWH